MTEDLQTKLQVVLDRQIELGVESIFSAVYSGPDTKTLSFYHLINRVMMVAQVPITFALFKNGAWFHTTNDHPRHREKIKKSMDAADPVNYFDVWYKSGEENKYTVLVLKADSTYEFTPLTPIKDAADIKTIWDAAAYKLWHVFNANRYARYGDSFFGILPTTLSRLAEKKSQLPATNTQDIDPTVVDHFNEELLKNSTEYELIGKGVLDRVFKKIENNISQITSQGEQETGILTNFILFARDYVGCPTKRWRYAESYDYALRVLLCSSQSEQIKKHLDWMLENEEECRELFKKQISAADQGRDIAQQVDQAFWDILAMAKNPSKRESKFNEILGILGGYFSEYARSMADPVYDGVSFYRQPFSHDAGMGRCFGGGSLPESLDDLRKNDVRRTDLLRVVICQYLFEAMAAKSASEDQTYLQIMLNPIEVGGRVWAVAGYATRSKDPRSEFASGKDIDQYDKYWSMNYHIYRDVNERMKKNLRTYMNRFYENFVAKQYEQWLYTLTSGGMKDGQKRSLTEAQDELNRILRSLSCVFPYNVVEGELKRTEEGIPVPASESALEDPETGDKARRALAGKHWATYMSVTDYSRFPPAPGVDDTKTFVDIVDVAVAMTDRTIRLVVRGDRSVKPNQLH